MIKIIFSDMDGTLLDGEGQLPVWFNNFAKKLEHKGIIFAPCSGRQYLALKETFKSYPNEFLYVAENGAAVFYKDKEIFSASFPKEKALKLWQAAQKNHPHICAVWCTAAKAYILAEQNRGAFRERLHYYGTKYTVIKSLDEIPDELIHIAFYDPDDDNAGEALMPELEPLCDNLRLLTDGSWVDAVEKGINKGTAIQMIQKKFGIKPEECAAFGDYLNDAEMMTAVTHSFAMANALPEIQKLAKYHTASNNDGGVLKGAEWLLLREEQ